MAHNFTISGSSLIVTDTESSMIVFESPSRDCFFNNSKIENEIVEIYDTSGQNESTGTIYEQPISNVQVNGVQATKSSLRNFQRLNLGFNSAAGGSAVVLNQQNFELIASNGFDSTKQYIINGIIDVGSVSIVIPAGGLNISGFDFNISKLISSENNFTMFTSPIGGSGDVIGSNYAIEVTGTGSKVYELISTDGFRAFEFERINYNDCSSLGSIENYRQGLETGTGRFGGSPSLELIGVWNGFRITTSIVRSLSALMTEPLFKAGTGFSMESRFLTDINCDLPALAPFCDFSPVNFPNPSTIQVFGATFTRDGAVSVIDTNIFTNVLNSDLQCSWRDNQGIKNTFEGGRLTIATEIDTVISTQSVFEVVAGTWSESNFQHFDSPLNGQIRHLGTSPREYILTSDLVVDGLQNDEVEIRIRKYNALTTLTSTEFSQRRQINALIGGRDVAFFNFQANVEMDINDYLFLEITNNSGTGNLTCELDSYFVVERR